MNDVGTDRARPTPRRTSFDGVAEGSPEDRLIEAARRLFCREGVHATGVARVLSEAGVSRKTLYERFGSKERLLEAMLEREGAEWLEWFEAGLARATGGPEARLAAAFDLIRDWAAAPDFTGCAFINVAAEHDKTDADILRIAQRHRDRSNAILLAIAEEAGLKDPETLVEQLGLLIDGAIVGAMITRNTRPVDDAQKAAAVLIQTARR